MKIDFLCVLSSTHAAPNCTLGDKSILKSHTYDFFYSKMQVEANWHPRSKQCHRLNKGGCLVKRLHGLLLGQKMTSTLTSNNVEEKCI